MNLLTLAKVREVLWAQGPNPVVYVSATQVQKDAFDVRLNQVVERYLSDMKPALLYRRVQVPVYNNSITLPRYLQSLLGVRPVNQNGCACSPLPIWTRFHEFAQTGCGSGLYGYWGGYAGQGGVAPTSETCQTFRDPTTVFRLKVTSTENGGTISFIGGYDTDWNEYFDDVDLSIVDGGSSTTTRQWPIGSMPRIHKDVTVGGVSLYAVDEDDAETLIAVYAPAETDPAYQRFSFPCFNGQVTVARILSRLTYVELVEDSDIVIPSRFGALKLGLMALNYEDRNDKTRADKYWADGMVIIDRDKQEFEGDAAIPLIDSAPGFACSNVPNII